MSCNYYAHIKTTFIPSSYTCDSLVQSKISNVPILRSYSKLHMQRTQTTQSSYSYIFCQQISLYSKINTLKTIQSLEPYNKSS